MKAFSGKRVRQHSGKLEGIAKRERRLRKIGLSLLNFEPNAQMNWVSYFKTRTEARKKSEV